MRRTPHSWGVPTSTHCRVGVVFRLLSSQVNSQRNDYLTQGNRTMTTPFDYYEIRHCAEYPDGHGGTFTNTLDGMSEDEAREESCVQTFWTLYGHVSGHGCEAILDRPQFVEVRHVYQRITGQEMPDREQDYTALPASESCS